MNNEYKHSAMTFPVGTTPDGRIITGDFGQVPHILVGGSTGSGKSNFLHALIRWLVQSHSPDELKLVLSDAKRVEFVDYAELPHLLCRIAHETDEFVAAFRKLERKLERRLESYACTDCTDIDEWNRRGNRGLHARIVAVIDEFADYMCAEGAIVEPLVRRLATDGARAGIHLVIATSRFGSDEIFTDGILAAVPGRMAFRSIDSDDSKRFLGAAGAECLAGQGDGFGDLPVENRCDCRHHQSGRKTSRIPSSRLSDWVSTNNRIPGIGEGTLANRNNVRRSNRIRENCIAVRWTSCVPRVERRFPPCKDVLESDTRRRCAQFLCSK